MSTLKSIRRGMVLTSVAVAVLGHSAIGATYTVTHLNTRGAFDLDDAGTVLTKSTDTTATSRVTTFSLITAGQWKRVSQSATQSITALSDHGTLLGYDMRLKSPFLQTKTGRRTNLVKAPGASNSYGNLINNSNTVIGAATYATGDSVARWNSPQSTPTVHGFLGGELRANVTAINNRNTATGWVYQSTANNTFGLRPIVWNGNKVTRLPTFGGPDAVATDINDAGVIVGFSDTQSLAAPSQGTIWKDGKIRSVGVLTGTQQSELSAINNAGIAVGSSNSYRNTRVNLAAVWDGAKLRDLNKMLDNAQGIRLTDAIDINNAGQILARGTINGNVSSFLLNPLDSSLPGDRAIVAASTRLLSFSTVAQVPEPTGVLAGLMLAAGLVKRRRVK
jgi:uncharacterized membrane protein